MTKGSSKTSINSTLKDRIPLSSWPRQWTHLFTITTTTTMMSHKNYWVIPSSNSLSSPRIGTHQVQKRPLPKDSEAARRWWTVKLGWHRFDQVNAFCCIARKEGKGAHETTLQASRTCFKVRRHSSMPSGPARKSQTSPSTRCRRLMIILSCFKAIKWG